MDYKNGQQEIINEDILSGKDILSVMPTGGGKSLCLSTTRYFI